MIRDLQGRHRGGTFFGVSHRVQAQSSSARCAILNRPIDLSSTKRYTTDIHTLRSLKSKAPIATTFQDSRATSTTTSAQRSQRRDYYSTPPNSASATSWGPFHHLKHNTSADIKRCREDRRLVGEHPGTPLRRLAAELLRRSDSCELPALCFNLLDRTSFLTFAAPPQSLAPTQSPPSLRSRTASQSGATENCRQTSASRTPSCQFSC